MAEYTGKRRGRPPKAVPDLTASLPVAQFNVWMYRADGPRLFTSGEAIPDGYVDTPAKVDGYGNR